MISRDILFLREKSKHDIEKYVDEKLPEEYEKCLVGLTSIIKEAWTMSRVTLDMREKIQALALAKDCYSMKLELLTNATVINDTIRFVSSNNNLLTEKAKAHINMTTYIEKGPNDIQGSAEDNQSAAEKPTNQTF